MSSGHCQWVYAPRAQVGEGEFEFDRRAVAGGIHGTVDMDDVGIVEAADDVEDGVHVADVGEELVAHPVPGGCAAREAGDVDAGDGHAGAGGAEDGAHVDARERTLPQVEAAAGRAHRALHA